MKNKSKHPSLRHDQQDASSSVPTGPLFCENPFEGGSPCCTILDSIGEGVFTINLDNQITFFNRAAELITGFDKEEAVGQYCFDIFRADVCEKKCPLDETLATQSPRSHYNALIISKDGEQKPISISTAVLKNKQGKITGGVEIFRDLTDMERLRKELNQNYSFADIVGQHPRIREILSVLPDIAQSDSTVLIEGPTGSGKELVARAIHNLSARGKGAFVAVNCAALPDTLLESELFGHSKGAFTGAHRDKPGRFMLAHQGTLFLDEIANTSLAFQADLLRVLETGEFTPLGGSKARQADFRVIAATNVDLKALSRGGEFREDLYYRLNVVKISLPSLAERKEDIPLLVAHFIEKFNLSKGRSIRTVTPEVLERLMRHSFPGNIRELANVIEYAFILCKGDLIDVEHLPKELLEKDAENWTSLPNHSTAGSDPEAEQIRSALLHHQGNRVEAARALGISRSTLWRKMKKHGLMAE
ncbi:sigma-54 interaction domain-containing protein [Desulfoferrobacter suflitae]|uniref:sigma-54 interaction domain-containing protein n=1 Tax=Desulfoferrobacter suflitae TaxID=2865782 RepID=UPI0021641DC5|nr:sigma 54-interacting transcriptional regulator [Desulfoferrobacter suflitae]MCK8603737.1 sigma 54-interacting transcriptional regulator [Desulfoferrobacter suflitae]